VPLDGLQQGGNRDAHVPRERSAAASVSFTVAVHRKRHNHECTRRSFTHKDFITRIASKIIFNMSVTVAASITFETDTGLRQVRIISKSTVPRQRTHTSKSTRTTIKRVAVHWKRLNSESVRRSFAKDFITSFASKVNFNCTSVSGTTSCDFKGALGLRQVLSTKGFR
jgi:hypothetical protein